MSHCGKEPPSRPRPEVCLLAQAQNLHVLETFLLSAPAGVLGEPLLTRPVAVEPYHHLTDFLRYGTKRDDLGRFFFSFVLNSVRDYDTLGFARFLREVFIYFLDVVSEPARLPKAKAPCMTPGITAGVGSVSVNDLCPPASSVSSFKHPGRYLRFFPPAFHRSVLRVLSWTEREKKS